MASVPNPNGGVITDKFPVRMPHPLRLSAALLIASVVVGCQDDTPVAPAQGEFDLTIEGARIDLSIVDRSALGDIGRLIGVETLPGGPLRGLGDPPIYAAPLAAPGDPPTFTPLETTVVLVYVTAWLYENGLLDDPSAISMVVPVLYAHYWLSAGDESNAVDSFNDFIQVVQGLVDNGLLPPGAGQWLIDCAQGAIDQLTGFCDLVATIPTAECEALVALYNSTDGDNWADNAWWLLLADPCSLFGVGCSGGHVLQLELQSNNLTGSIPADRGCPKFSWNLK